MATTMSRSRSVRRQKEIAAARATRASAAATWPSETWIEVAHASASSSGPQATTRPAFSRTARSASRRACSGSWLTTISEMSSSARSSASVASIASRAVVVERRGRLVEQQHGRLLGRAPGPASPAAARRPRACRRRARRSRDRARRGRGSAPRRAPCRPGRRRSAGSTRPSPPAATAAAAPARPRAAAPAGRTRSAADPGRRSSPGVRVGEPVEQPQQGRLAAARGADDRRRAGVDLGADRVEDEAVAAGEADVAKLEQHRRMIPHRPQEASRRPPAPRRSVRDCQNPGR